MLWLLLLAAAVAFVFYKLWKLKNYWQDRNIPHKEPVLFFGHVLDAFRGKKTFVEILQETYEAFPDSRYVGFSQVTSPVLYIKDPELIKQIYIKDSEYFPERQIYSSDDDSDPLWHKNLFSAKATKWRELRPAVSPTFTSSKMKLMFTLMDDAAQRFTEYFKKQDEKSIELELKDVFSRFTNDVIATTAFGIECNSLQNQNNEFYLMGKDITDADALRTLKVFALLTFPRLLKLFGVKLFPKASTEFFVDIIDTTMRERQQKKILRPDLIHLLLELRRNSGSTLQYEEQDKVTESEPVSGESAYSKQSKHKELTDDEIHAQCIVFFVGGFDTVSNALVFANYELALNIDVQEKLRKEIDDTWQECDGKLTYEALNNMKYMDMVVSETLRKWPPTGIAERRCAKPYTIPPVLPKEKEVEIQAGQTIAVPIASIQMDEKYFPDPKKFDPERFSDENKHNIKSGTYLPFGMGPRNCIGMRFALLEIKTLLFHLLRNFEIAPNKKTPIPWIPSKKGLNLVAENGTWVDFIKR